MTPAEERDLERRQAVAAAIARTKTMLRLARKQFEDTEKVAYNADVSAGVWVNGDTPP